MEKVAIIKRMNRDHLEKLRRFSEASEEDKLKFAFDSNFWGHDCFRYVYEGHCLDCGARVLTRHSAAVRRVPIPRRVGRSFLKKASGTYRQNI